jgi:4-hydroxy-tetrahydrodipicolinate reductase
MTKPRLALIGDGKMGRAIAQLASERGLDVLVTFGEENNPSATGISRESLRGADVAIEFTEPTAAVDNIRACVRAGCPIVVGTTGWYDALPEVTSEVQRSGGSLLWSANFSLGVNIMLALVEQAARLTRQAGGFDRHIIETHHTAKKDAPSGTALILQRAAQLAGQTVPITSVRTGSVPGTHEIVFDAQYEQLTMTHVARDRRVFAAGALTAAQWLVGRQGVFTMQDVLAGTEGRS